jgi:hypothetical protein
MMLITKDIFGNTSAKITPNLIREVSSILIIAKRLNSVPTYIIICLQKKKLMGHVQMMNTIIGPRGSNGSSTR